MFADISMKDRRVLITAGASGIGLEITRAFSGAGCHVVICDIDEVALATAKRELPSLVTIKANVADEASVKDLFIQAKETLGGLDVLINNAGIAGPTGPVQSLSKTDWDQTLAVNITSQFLCAREAVPLLKSSAHGVILNLSSAAGHLGFAGRTPYSASKWAVVGFTKSLAIELGPFGIRVNAILPGAVDGPRIRAVIAAKAKTLNVPEDVLTKRHEQQAVLGRLIPARDVANMALFAASDAARNLTGQELVVDGHTQALI
jgi:NAD(P)-dependent dehydrogenase (short-subunit alcohol dehydrogenase family)|uniref:SDR family oxidoreductase n=1 Tax=Orrella sp. TaxID=1921583 RepID=UPI004047A97B